MPQSRRRLPHAALLLFCLGLSAYLPPLTAAPMIGAATLDGEAVQLADYFSRGRWTLVVVWTTYCPVCAREFPHLSQLAAAHDPRQFKVLGIAIDGIEARSTVARTLTERAAQFDSLVADPDEIKAAYRRLTGSDFQGTPTYLLFDGDGELAASSTGPLAPADLEQFLDQHQP